jgi:hypothetical protein
MFLNFTAELLDSMNSVYIISSSIRINASNAAGTLTSRFGTLYFCPLSQLFSHFHCLTAIFVLTSCDSFMPDGTLIGKLSTASHAQVVPSSFRDSSVLVPSTRKSIGEPYPFACVRFAPSRITMSGARSFFYTEEYRYAQYAYLGGPREVR